MNEASREDWLGTANALELLALHPTTLLRWRKAGMLPASYLDAQGRWRYSRADLGRIRQRRAGMRRPPDHAGTEMARPELADRMRTTRPSQFGGQHQQ